MHAGSLTVKYAFALAELIATPPTEWASAGRGYTREDQRIKRRVATALLAASGVYATLRLDHAEKSQAELRHLRLSVDAKLLDLEVRKAIDRTEMLFEVWDKELGNAAAAITLEDHDLSWLRANFKARETWIGSDDSIDFVEAVDSFLENARALKEPDVTS